MYKNLSQNEVLDNAKFFYPSSNKNIGSFSIKNDFANVKYEYFNVSPRINLVTVKSNFLEDTCIKEQTDKNLPSLSFNLGENFFLQDSKREANLNFNKGICYINTFYPHKNSSMLYTRNKFYSTIHITFEDELFNKLFEHKKINTIFKSDDFTMNFHNHISSHQNILLQEILKQPFDENDILSQIFLESKLLELIHLTANLKQKNKEAFSLNNQDIECIHKAKEILLSDIQNPPSLNELAHKSALNTYKLKVGFKYIFGNTVYGFLKEYRLNEAKKLLKNNNIDINEATKLVGYKNQGHFSKIFKEYFGINPIELKKEKKIYF